VINVLLVMAKENGGNCTPALDSIFIARIASGEFATGYENFLRYMIPRPLTRDALLVVTRAFDEHHKLKAAPIRTRDN